ncbi:unnamed protein product, partial [Porites evermanni]
ELQGHRTPLQVTAAYVNGTENAILAYEVSFAPPPSKDKNSPDSDKEDLLSELNLMKQMKPHPHVIKLLGCVTETEPLLVLIEYIPYGDLLGFLRKSRGLKDTYYN